MCDFQLIHQSCRWGRSIFLFMAIKFSWCKFFATCGCNRWIY